MTNQPKIKNIACAILAGGASRRMGRDKAFLDWYGRSFIEVIRDNVSTWFDEVFIVTGREELFGHMDEDVVRDVIPDKGPMGGLYTALETTGKEKVFCIACDMPFQYGNVIKGLLRVSEQENFDCFVPRGERGIEPLFSIYRSDIKDVVRAEIRAGQLRMSDMLKKVHTYFFDIKEFSEELVNINTPQEYALSLRGAQREANSK